MGSPWIRPRSFFSKILNGILFGMDPLNVPAKFGVRSFTRSWDNSDWRFGGCEPPALGKRRPSALVPLETTSVSSYRPSVVTFFLYLYAFQRYCRFCAPARHFSHLTSSLPKISPCSLGLGWWPLGYEQRRCWANVRAISFQDFQPMWSWSTNVIDGQTDDMQS